MKIASAFLVLGLASALVCACGSGNPATDLTTLSSASECGGFEQGGNPILDYAGAYCDAEVLHWRYLADEQKLTLVDARMLLNCCGEHDMLAEMLPDGTLLVTEVDEPDNGGRCDCMCVFDFALDVSPIAAGTLAVDLKLFVRDMPGDAGTTTDVWAGELDLSAGSGFVILDDQPTAWCGID